MPATQKFACPPLAGEEKSGIKDRMLYVVATPIGNLGDITLRALEVLKSVDFVACEDTRRTGILLKHYHINKPLITHHSYNKKGSCEHIVRHLKGGRSIALVSDAGTPGVSDPGVALVSRAIKENIPLTVIPGPSGVISGLVLSGMPAHKFVFEGFLPVKQAARIRRLRELRSEKRTIVIYESPHRMVRAVGDMMDVFGDIEMVCIREATKKFEEVVRSRISKIIERFKAKPPKGEFILVLNLSLAGDFS